MYMSSLSVHTCDTNFNWNGKISEQSVGMHERNGYFTNCESHTAAQMKITVVIHIPRRILHRVRGININNEWFYADEKISSAEKNQCARIWSRVLNCGVECRAKKTEWLMKRQPRHKNIKEARILFFFVHFYFSEHMRYAAYWFKTHFMNMRITSDRNVRNECV